MLNFLNKSRIIVTLIGVIVFSLLILFLYLTLGVQKEVKREFNIKIYAKK